MLPPVTVHPVPVFPCGPCMLAVRTQASRSPSWPKERTYSGNSQPALGRHRHEHDRLARAAGPTPGTGGARTRSASPPGTGRTTAGPPVEETAVPARARPGGWRFYAAQNTFPAGNPAVPPGPADHPLRHLPLPVRLAMTERPTRGPADSLRLQDTLRLSAEGLAMVLGDLEARAMRTVWSLAEPASAREIHARVVEEHRVAHLTVVTVLNKLVGKGLLCREKRDGVYHYAACWTEEELRAHVSRRVVEGMLSFEPHALAASFVDALAARDRAALAELRRLIDRRLREDQIE